MSRLLPSVLHLYLYTKSSPGLYAGYKKRNAQLDALTQSPPEYLKTTSVALANQTFQDVTSGEAVDVLHKHLSRRHALLCLVISARKLHHSHFFAETYDYGHQVWKPSLTNWSLELSYTALSGQFAESKLYSQPRT